MRKLSGLDAAFINVENHRNYGHTSGLLVVDPTGLDEPFDAARVKRLMAERIHLIDPFRWRLVEVPLGLDHPWWVEDPDLDLDFHIRELALPAPTRECLAEQVARLQARHLDRARPLWEMYVIHGLEHGHVGVFTKFHHALVDGVSAMSIVGTLLDTTQSGRILPPQPASRRLERLPSQWELLGRAARDFTAKPGGLLRLSARALGPAWEIARAGLPIVGHDRPVMPLRAPKTSFNRMVGSQRRWASGTVALSDVKSVKDHYGCTVNDVVMAMCATAVRRWLVDHAELPERPLVAAVPVSVRTAAQAAAMGNQVSMMLATMPTDIEDPVERLLFTMESMRGAKEQHDALPAGIMQDFAEFAAPAAAQLVAKAVSELRVADRVDLPYNFVVSNVPGPRHTLYFAGAPMVANYPISMVADGLGLNITLTSYKDSIDFGVIVDRDLIPDVANIVTYLEEALEELLDSTHACRTCGTAAAAAV